MVRQMPAWQQIKEILFVLMDTIVTCILYIPKGDVSSGF